MEIGAYKPHFPESAEGRKKPSRFLEKIDGYINQLQKLKETVKLKEEAAPAAPAPAAAPAPQIEEVETSESVVEKGMGNLAISIIKDFGLRDPMLAKLMRASETLDETPGVEEDIELPTDEEAAPAEGTDESGLDGLDLDLDLSGAAEAPAEGETAPAEEEIDLSTLGTDETPAEAAPEEEITLPEEEPTDKEEPKKKSDEELKKAQEELLGVEDSEPLDLADFTFKN